MLPILPGIGDSHALASVILNKIINANFLEVYAKCTINVFGSFIFRKLRLKYKKREKKSAKSLLFELFLKFDIHILYLLICDVSFHR